MLVHTELAIKAAKDSFPWAGKFIFRFDNSPNHLKYAEDALNTNNMNVHPGGEQSKLRNTCWSG